VLIIRRSYCINTASGIVLSVSDRPVCRLGILSVSVALVIQHAMRKRHIVSLSVACPHLR